MKASKFTDAQGRINQKRPIFFEDNLATTRVAEIGARSRL